MQLSLVISNDRVNKLYNGINNAIEKNDDATAMYKIISLICIETPKVNNRFSIGDFCIDYGNRLPILKNKIVGFFLMMVLLFIVGSIVLFLPLFYCFMEVFNGSKYNTTVNKSKGLIAKFNQYKASMGVSNEFVKSVKAILGENINEAEVKAMHKNHAPDNAGVIFVHPQKREQNTVLEAIHKTIIWPVVFIPKGLSKLLNLRII